MARDDVGEWKEDGVLIGDEMWFNEVVLNGMGRDKTEPSGTHGCARKAIGSFKPSFGLLSNMGFFSFPLACALPRWTNAGAFIMGAMVGITITMNRVFCVLYPLGWGRTALTGEKRFVCVVCKCGKRRKTELVGRMTVTSFLSEQTRKWAVDLIRLGPKMDCHV